MHSWSKFLLSSSSNARRLISTRWAHSLEGPEPTYQQVVSGYEVYKHQDGPFKLKYNNKSLNEFQLAYETWGKLNAKKNNAILIFTGLSASSHAKSHELNTRPGWWEKIYWTKFRY